VSHRFATTEVGTLKNKVDVQHGLENAPAALRRLFEGRNEGTSFCVSPD
jgi:NADPH-dependent curcumin reductase CurA